MPTPRVVILAVADRSARLALHAVLREGGYAVRIVTRAAEYAKALADGRAVLVVRSAQEPAPVLDGATMAPVPTVLLDPMAAREQLLATIHDALAG